MDDYQKDLETDIKVVSIMQTITEELDEKGKRMLRKILGMDHSGDRTAKEARRKTGDD